jgi:hypothetical protein
MSASALRRFGERRAASGAGRRRQIGRIVPLDALSRLRQTHPTQEVPMAVDPARARELALSLPLAGEAPHFDRLAFRTPRKIFATLSVKAGDLNLMFNPDLRDFYCEQAPQAFAPVPGGWGLRGATRCDLQKVDEATLMSALEAAHQLAAPKAGKRQADSTE